MTSKTKNFQAPPEERLLESLPEFITAYGPKRRVQFTPSGKSRTKQSFKDECDVNVIMKRYAATGQLPLSERVPQYADTSAIDYQEAMFTVAEANSAFQSLPAHIRARFENDPAQLLDFVHDEENREEAQELGLLRPSEGVATPVPTPPASVAPATPTPNVAGVPPAATPPTPAK